jgi:hypothetical protein
MWPPGVEPVLRKGVYLASKVKVEAIFKLNPGADVKGLWQRYPWHILAAQNPAGQYQDGIKKVTTKQCFADVQMRAEAFVLGRMLACKILDRL